MLTTFCLLIKGGLLHSNPEYLCLPDLKENDQTKRRCGETTLLDLFPYSNFKSNPLQLQKYSSDGGWSQNAGEVGPFQVSCPTRWSLSLNCIDQLDVIYRHPEKNSPSICWYSPRLVLRQAMPQRYLQHFQLDSELPCSSAH